MARQTHGDQIMRSGDLFDRRPIDLGGFRLKAHTVEAYGTPTFEQWVNAMEFTRSVHKGSPYWWGELFAYAETRQDWAEKMAQALEASGYERQTLLNLSWIVRHVDEEARQMSPSVGHSAEVAPLPPADQRRLLAKATEEGWTVRDLRLNIRSEKRARVIEGQAVLEGLFRVIYADPPWKYGDRPPSGSGQADHYHGMTIDEICKLPVAAHSLPNAVLFMWTTAPFLLENPGPREVIEAWGFTPKTQRIWDKVDHNWGHYVSVRHEILIIATRGSCTPDRPTPMLDSVVTERVRPDAEHSGKPESFRKDIERMYDGPYLELFGRRPIEGWTVFGDDARLWPTQMGAYA